MDSTCTTSCALSAFSATVDTDPFAFADLGGASYTPPGDLDLTAFVTNVFGIELDMGSYASGAGTWGLLVFECPECIVSEDYGTFTVSTTPLPAALPLFATGLGAMGLFGWRRKRKNATALAA